MERQTISVPESQFEKNRQLILLKVIQSSLREERLTESQSYTMISEAITLLENGHTI